MNSVPLILKHNFGSHSLAFFEQLLSILAKTTSPQEAASRLIVPGTLHQLPFSLNDDTEFDAEALLALVMDAATGSLKAAAQARPDLQVGLVGVSVFAVTVICLDSGMKPLWNACSYADKRTFSFAEAARAKMQPELLQQLSDPSAFPFSFNRHQITSEIIFCNCNTPFSHQQLRRHWHSLCLPLRSLSHPPLALF